MWDQGHPEGARCSSCLEWPRWPSSFPPSSCLPRRLIYGSTGCNTWPSGSRAMTAWPKPSVRSFSLMTPGETRTAPASTSASVARPTSGTTKCVCPVHEIVRALAVRHRPSPARSLVFEQLDARPLGSPKSRDPQPCAEHAVETLLLEAVVQALTRDTETKDVSIEPETGSRLVRHDSCVVDPPEQDPVGPMLFRIALARGHSRISKE